MAAEPWLQAAEVLLLRVGRLLHERDNLAEALSEAKVDATVASARIKQLEHLNQALRAELYELGKTKASKRNVGSLSAGIGAILIAVTSAIGGSATGAAIDHLLEAQNQAVSVQIYCGIPIEIIPPDQTVTVPSVPSGRDAPKPETRSDQPDLPDEEKEGYGSYSGGYGSTAYGTTAYGGGSPQSRRLEREVADEAPAADASAEVQVSSGDAREQIALESDLSDRTSEDEGG